MTIEIVDKETEDVVASSDTLGETQVAMLVGLLSKERRKRVSFHGKGIYMRASNPTLVTEDRIIYYVIKV